MKALIAVLLLASMATAYTPINFGAPVRAASLSEIKGPGGVLGVAALTLGGVTITTALLRAVVRPSTPKAERTWNVILASMAGASLACMFTSYAFQK